MFYTENREEKTEIKLYLKTSTKRRNRASKRKKKNKVQIPHSLKKRNEKSTVCSKAKLQSGQHTYFYSIPS